jgi:ATP/maltotriose-dependent transcriptional regulator MalT
VSKERPKPKGEPHFPGEEPPFPYESGVTQPISSSIENDVATTINLSGMKDGVPAHLVNRCDEVKKLNEWLNNENKRICFIEGPPGRGKTYFVAKFVMGLINRAKTKWMVHWVECEEDGKQIGLNDLLAGFYERFVGLEVERLKKEEITLRREEIFNNPQSEDEQSKSVGDEALPLQRRLAPLFHRLARHSPNTRWLIVLNDYHSAEGIIDGTGIIEFVKEAAKAPGAKVICVTRGKAKKTRKQIKIRNACSSWELKPLGKDYSLEYLRALEIEDLSKIEAETIWERCASGEPLLLDYFAGALVDGQNKDQLLSMAYPQWDQEVKDWINERVVSRLSDDERLVASAASIALDFADQEMIRAMCGLPTEKIEYVFESLKNKYLFKDAPIQKSAVVCHQVLRECLQESMNDVQKKSLHSRIAQWFEDQAYDNQAQPEKRLENLQQAYFHWQRAGNQLRSFSCARNIQQLLMMNDISLLEKQADILSFQQDYEPASTMLEQAEGLSRELDDKPIIERIVKRKIALFTEWALKETLEIDDAKNIIQSAIKAEAK